MKAQLLRELLCNVSTLINASEKGYTYNIILTGTPEAWSSRLPVHNGRPLSASHEAWVSSRGAVACGVGGASLLPGPAAHWDRRLWLCHVSFGQKWGDEWRRCLCVVVVVGVIWCCGCVVCVYGCTGLVLTHFGCCETCCCWEARRGECL